MTTDMSEDMSEDMTEDIFEEMTRDMNKDISQHLRSKLRNLFSIFLTFPLILIFLYDYFLWLLHTLSQLIR